MKTIIIDIDDLNPNNREQMDCEIFILKDKFNIEKNIDGSIDRLRNLLKYLFNTYMYT